MEYKQWLDILSTTDVDDDLSESNVIEKIKKKLEKEDPGTYQEWQNNQFDINYTFADQCTLLHIAAQQCFVKVTKLLITKGADVDKTGQYGQTSLHYTIGSGLIEVVNILIEAGANIDAVEESKRTPLHYASCYGHVEIVNVLLHKGANFELKDEKGSTPLDYATNNKHPKVIDALNKFRVTYESSLKTKHALNQFKNNIASSGTFPGGKSSFFGDTYREYNNTSSMESLPLEKVTELISESDNVHSILNIQQKAANYYGSTSSLDCSSIQGVEGLQTNLESKNAPVQRNFQLREHSLYDVNQKIFDSFDGSTTREIVQNPQIGLPNNLGIDGVSTQESQSTEENSVLENKKVSQLEQAFAKKNQEFEGMKYQLREKTRDLGVANKKVSQLEQELGSAQRELAAKNQEFAEVIYQLREKERALDQRTSQLGQEWGSAQQELAAKSQELETMGYQSREKTRDLGVANKKVSQLEQELGSAQRELAAKNQEFAEVIYQLREKERALDQRTSQLGQEWGSAQRELAAKTKEYESAQARSEELQKQLESKNEELNGKNEKFLRVSTHSKRQGKCASVFFVLSCAFTVGASLTIPYLATCVTLAIAASIFLAVGCYCSYKANTALNNVEVDQVAKGANPVIV